MAYIEENLKVLREQQRAGGSRGAATEAEGSGKDEVGDMVKFGDKYKTTSKELKEGSVTASLAMLSAIPEVDLGME
jgi:Hepatocellular carcinoma-associated antigen 59